MQYEFKFSREGESNFALLPRVIQKRIFKKLEYFAALKNPLSMAKALSGTKNKYRFRVGDYRIIVSKLCGNSLVVLLILKIGHRKNVYE